MKILNLIIATTLAASAAYAGEKGAGTEGRQWLAKDQNPTSLLPPIEAGTRAVTELTEAAAGLNYDSVTKIWGIPVPRLGDPDYSLNNLNYTGVMRDAPLTLPARVFVPDGKIDRTLPCMLVTNGYGVGTPGSGTGGGEGGMLSGFVAQGYTAVEVAMREASSEPQNRQVGISGYYRYFAEDGVAIVNEMVRRFGCGMTNNDPTTARVGMMGASLVGGSQWSIVSRNLYPAALRAIAPDSPGVNHLTYSTLWYPGGMLPGPQRITRPGQELGNNFPAHRDYDEFWADLTVSTGQLRSAASRRLALLLTGGWYEYNTPGNLAAYEDFNALSGDTNKRLVMSPSGHTLPTWLYRPLVMDWMARYVKGDTNRAEQPRVLLYVRGADSWRAEKEWPIADTKYVMLNLSAKKSGTIASLNDGSLIAGAAGSGTVAKYGYSPTTGPFLHVMVGGLGAGGPPGTGGAPGMAAGPAPGGMAAGGAPGMGAGAAPAAGGEGGPDAGGPETLNTNIAHPFSAATMAADEKQAVTWTSATLNTAMEVTGNPVLKFWASSSTDDADFVAMLTDVAPDGASKFIIQGYLNGPREAFTRRDAKIAAPAPLEPGVARQFTMTLNPTSYVVPAGHRIRITIAGGADLAEGQRSGQGPGKNNKAFEVSVLQSADKAATLELPVVGTLASTFATAQLGKK